MASFALLQASWPKAYGASRSLPSWVLRESTTAILETHKEITSVQRGLRTCLFRGQKVSPSADEPLVQDKHSAVLRFGGYSSRQNALGVVQLFPGHDCLSGG